MGIRIAALLLAMAGWCRAEDIKVDGALKVPSNDLVQLKASGAPAGATYFWSVMPKDGTKPRLRTTQLKRLKDCLHFTAADGVYIVNVRAAWTLDKATGALDGSELDIEVAIGDDLPKPPAPVPDPPTPHPGPVDPPRPDPVPPKADKLWMIVVKDNEAMTPAVAEVVMDRSLWKEVEAAGHRWRVYSSASTQAAAKGFAAYLAEKKVALPGLVVMDAAGNRIAALPLPANKAGVLAAMKEHSK